MHKHRENYVEPGDLFWKILLLTKEPQPQNWPILDKEGYLKTNTDDS